jgi:hypothetical protein
VVLRLNARPTPCATTLIRPVTPTRRTTCLALAVAGLDSIAIEHGVATRTRKVQVTRQRSTIGDGSHVDVDEALAIVRVAVRRGEAVHEQIVAATRGTRRCGTFRRAAALDGNTDAGVSIMALDLNPLRRRLQQPRQYLQRDQPMMPRCRLSTCRRNPHDMPTPGTTSA